MYKPREIYLIVNNMNTKAPIRNTQLCLDYIELI